MQSMTGFGAAEWSSDSARFSCEVKSVNSRFLEVSCRLPKSLLALEAEATALVKSVLGRGKVDLFIDTKSASSAENLPQLNMEALRNALAIVTTASREAHGISATWAAPNVTDVLRMDGVLESKTGTQDREAWLETNRVGILKVVEQALKALVRSRTQEGSGLKTALLEMTRAIEADRCSLASRVDELRTGLFGAYRKRLEALAQSLGDGQVAASVKAIPDERLTQEIVILADKSDIEEELKRLGIHTKEFETSLEASGPQGRRLDFLCQEMHREVNTISAKLFAPETGPTILAMKQAVERIRQQIQNVE